MFDLVKCPIKLVVCKSNQIQYLSTLIRVIFLDFSANKKKAKEKINGNARTRTYMSRRLPLQEPLLTLVLSPINVIKTINVIPTINVIRIDHKCNTDHKCKNF